MIIHVSYQFQTGDGASGFGDATIVSLPRRISDGRDVESLRSRIKRELEGEGKRDVNVVLIAWQEISP
jgi:hypothetical protein